MCRKSCCIMTFGKYFLHCSFFFKVWQNCFQLFFLHACSTRVYPCTFKLKERIINKKRIVKIKDIKKSEKQRHSEKFDWAYLDRSRYISSNWRYRTLLMEPWSMLQWTCSQYIIIWYFFIPVHNYEMFKTFGGNWRKFKPRLSRSRIFFRVMEMY